LIKRLLTSIIILLLIIVSTCAGVTTAHASNDDVKFVRPSDTFIDDNYIYVLDRVDNDTVGIIQRFDINGGNRTRYTLDTCYDSIYSHGNTVYLLKDGYLCWGTLGLTNFSLVGSYAQTDNNKRIVNGNIAVIQEGLENYIFACGSEYMVVIKQSTGAFFTNAIMPNCTDIVYSTTVGGDCFIFALGSTGICAYYFDNGNLVSIRNNTSYTNNAYSLLGVNSITNNADNLTGAQLYLYDKQQHNYCQLDFVNSTLTQYSDQDNQTLGSADVTIDTNNTYAYITKGNNTITRYTINSAVYKLNLDSTFSLGTNSIDLPIPSQDAMLGWHVCRTTGYPTNILYGATQATDNSVDYGTLRSDDVFIVYTYENWQNDNYYLIMYNGRYGFVEKGTKSDITADELDIQQTTVFLQGRVSSVAHVYSAPYVADRYHICALTQGTVVTISDMLTIWGHNYYLINYMDNTTACSGWIRQESVGDITIDNTISIEGVSRVNPPLGHQLPVYADSSLTAYAKFNEQDINLEVGQSVTVINTQNNISLIQAEIDTEQGKSYIIGYVSADMLINHGLTNYQALGLSLFIVSISLALFLVIIVVRRRIKVRRESEGEQFDFGEDKEEE